MAIHTERLTLEPVPSSDSSFWVFYGSVLSNPAVSTMGWGEISPEPWTEEEVMLLHGNHRAAYEKRGYGLFAISLKRDETDAALDAEWVGYCQLRNLDDMPKAFTDGYEDWHPRAGEIEILYGLDPRYWGQGFAKEFVRRASGFAIDELQLHSVTACAIPQNMGSRKVLESAGFVQTTESLRYSKPTDVYYQLSK